MESWYQWIVRLLQLDIFNTLIKIYPMKMIKSSAAGLGRISLIKIKLHEKFNIQNTWSFQIKNVELLKVLNPKKLVVPDQMSDVTINNSVFFYAMLLVCKSYLVSIFRKVAPFVILTLFNFKLS